jgi:carboxymethylenebutenolidase
LGTRSLGFCGPSPEKIPLKKEQKMGTHITIHSADGARVTAYAAQPTGTPRGAVVVLQEIFGLNAHIRAVADGYAAAGYYAVAPATFHRVQPGVELGYTQEDMAQGFALRAQAEAKKALVLQDIQATIDHAAQYGKVGVVGYCWGGLMTWRAAQGLRGISAAVPYYGGGMHLEIDRAPQCPSMAHLSNDDAYVPMDGVAALQKTHPQVTVHLYAAKHGFNCDARAAYNVQSAQLARTRTLEFFAQHLG